MQATPDLGEFPNLARALPARIELTLCAGEVLFIPACVAHEITGELLDEHGAAVDHVLSVNRFWCTDAQRVEQFMPQDCRLAARAIAGSEGSSNMMPYK